MRKQGIGLLCAAALLMTGCRAPRRPTETVWLESDEKLSAALPGLRRLARAGCLLPEPPTPPKPDFEVIGTAFPRPGGENTLRILARAARRMNAENREEKHYRQVLTRYYAEVLPTFDAAIERFVADHAAGAFLLTTRGVEGVPVEFTVLPERGFAFARTPGMATRALPRPIPATVEPPAGGAHPEVVLRHTGRRSWMQFTPIAYIPWWTWRTMHYYSLTVGGRTGACWMSTSPKGASISR